MMTIVRHVDPVPLLAVAARLPGGCVDDSCRIDPAATP
jgi:hypothetical protein